MKKACLVCGREFETNYKIKKYCSEKCRMFAKNNRTRSGCQCVICGHKAEVLTKHLKIAHNLTPDEYCTIYKLKKSDVISDGMSKKLSDAQKNSELCVANKFSSKNNPAKGHSGRYSPYSMNFIRYDGMTDEEKKRAIADVRERKQKSVRENPQNQPTRIEFYTSRGLSPDEARKALSERQRTFSLEKCIERYGDDEGMRVWKERQERWQETLNSKPPEEIERINRAKNFCGKGYSKISQTLFWKIYNKLKDFGFDIYFATLDRKTKQYTELNNEFFVNLHPKHYFLDFYVKDKNKVIEFDGEYWHESSARGNKKRDADRDRILTENGYEVLHVREKEYIENEKDVIERCLDFILK